MSGKQLFTFEQNVSVTAPLEDSFRISRSSPSAELKNIKSVEKSVWCTDYASDIILSLKESEKRRITLDYKSQQTSFRPSLLILMKTAADSLSLSRTTLHLAVYLLDCFMDTYTIIMEKLNASALMSLLIAAKIEETDKNVPKFDKFNELVGNVYSCRDFRTVELKILSAVNYDLIYPTVATFVESYSNQLVSFEDFLRYHVPRACDTQKKDIHYASYEAMLLDTTSLLFNIADISLHDNRLVNYTPSVIAAACIAATRSYRKIEPIWTERLVALTGYDFATIAPYTKALESMYVMYARTEVICESPDSGIASDSKSESEDDDCDLAMCHHYQPAPKRRRIFN